jgi:regulatory protein
MAERKEPAKLDANGLWDYALRVLARRPHSVSELKTKLGRRAQSPADLTQTLAKLREYGLTNDRKFSEAFASARLQNQGYGRFRVLRDLRARRVAPEVAEDAVSKTFKETDELELIGQYLDRKYRGRNLPEMLQDENTLASIYRRLRLAGFSSSNTLTVLRRYKQDIADVNEEAEE